MEGYTMVTLDVSNVCLRIAQSSNCSTIAVCVQVGCEYMGTLVTRRYTRPTLQGTNAQRHSLEIPLYGGSLAMHVYVCAWSVFDQCNAFVPTAVR